MSMFAMGLIAVTMASEPPRLQLEIELDDLRDEQVSALWYLAPSLLLPVGGAAFAATELRHWAMPVGAQGASVWGKVTLGVGAGSLAFGALITMVILYLRDERYARIAELEARMEQFRSDDDARLDQGLELSPARMRIRALERERPGLAAAAWLLTGGVVAGVLSIFNWASWNGHEGTLLAIGIPLDLVAGALVGAGLWQLIARWQRRGEIDLEIRHQRGLDAMP